MENLIKILEIIFGCSHKYEVIEKIDCYENDGDSLPLYKKYVSRCTKCGKISSKIV